MDIPALQREPCTKRHPQGPWHGVKEQRAGLGRVPPATVKLSGLLINNVLWSCFPRASCLRVRGPPRILGAEPGSGSDLLCVVVAGVGLLAFFGEVGSATDGAVAAPAPSVTRNLALKPGRGGHTFKSWL